jgi:hypothetical protein
MEFTPLVRVSLLIKLQCKERKNVCLSATHLNSAWSPAIAAAVGASSFIVRA